MNKYPYSKIESFIDPFIEGFEEELKSQGWNVYDSDAGMPYPSENGRYFQVQRNDEPGILESDEEAYELAKELGLILDKYGVVIGNKKRIYFDPNKKSVTVEFTFKGTVKVETEDNDDNAIEIVKNSFGLVIGDLHENDDRIIDWDFDMHPEKKVYFSQKEDFSDMRKIKVGQSLPYGIINSLRFPHENDEEYDFTEEEYGSNIGSSFLVQTDDKNRKVSFILTGFNEKEGFIYTCIYTDFNS